MRDLTLIMADVARAKRTNTPIYDGTAKTIACGWHGGGNHDMTAFSSSGHIGDSLKLEIKAEIENVKANPQNFDADETVMDLGTAKQNIAQLRALLVYVKKCGKRGPVDGWGRVWVCPLSPEDEFNSDDDE